MPTGQCPLIFCIETLILTHIKVPNRHNYILWLKDLLDTSSYNEPGQKLTGLDIGTGASCIYPLLGCVQRPWSFIATGTPLADVLTSIIQC